MPYRITVTSEFCAAMQLPNIDGPCAQLHGHTYQVAMTISAEQLNKAGVVCDYFSLKKQLDDYLKNFDYQYLNDHPLFTQQAPSSEAIAKLIFQHFKGILAAESIAMNKVAIKERGLCEVCYYES